MTESPSRHPLAGEPPPVIEDDEYDDFEAVCNFIEKGTSLGIEITTIALERCMVRQVRTLENGGPLPQTISQDNTPTLPTPR